jgi:peptidoglycan/xylan/chitin deacetylase (PgdA/CDA1 family)
MGLQPPFLLPKPMKTWAKWVLRHVYQIRADAPSVAVLTFHEIHPAGSYTPLMFETLLTMLARRVEFLTLSEACARLRQGRPLLQDAVVLTFDDGLRSQFVYAYPLLQRYQVKATFFVVPGLMTERRWLWNHEALVRLEETLPEDFPQLPELACCRGSQPGSQVRQKYAQDVVEQMKRLPEPPRQHILGALRAVHPHLLQHHPLTDRYDLMTWDDLRRLDTGLVEIGSHSSTHAILQGLPGHRLAQEVRASRLALEQRLGRPVPSFCYPNGDYDDATLHWVRRCYDQAVTVAEQVAAGPCDFHQLPRVWVSSDHEDTLFRLARHQWTLRQC